MIIRTEQLKDVCQMIVGAVDSSNGLSKLTETLELKVVDNTLMLSVTNKEYYVRVKLPVDYTGDFHAAVNADLFLKLIAQTTTETIDLKTNDTNLMVKGNGTYKIPLVYEDDGLIEVPEIKINNATNSFPINADVLLSILQYNSKELLKGTISKPVQKLYYVDELGAITFTSGACVNSFTLAQPVKMLLNNKVVKLFKLFKTGDVMFTIGYDNITDEIIQTKVRFESDDISITAILSCDDTLLRSVPTTAIRNRANTEYPYSVSVNKDSLLQTINRLTLFAGKDTLNLYSKFEFKKDSVTIYDARMENKEEIFYTSGNIDIEDMYSVVLDFVDLKMTLETCTEQYINIHFGNQTALVISRGNVKNVVPEIRTL